MASQHGVISKIIVNKCYPFVDLKRICQLSVLSPPNWNRSFHVSFVEFAQQKVFNLPLIQYPSQHQIGFCFLSFFGHLHLCRSSRYLNIHIIPAADDAKTLSLILLQLLWNDAVVMKKVMREKLICVSLKTNFRYGIHWSCRSTSIKLIMKRFAPWSAVHQTSHEPEMKQSNRLVGWTSAYSGLHEPLRFTRTDTPTLYVSKFLKTNVLKRSGVRQNKKL